MNTARSVSVEAEALVVKLASRPSCDDGSDHVARLPNLLDHLRRRQEALQQVVQTAISAGAISPRPTLI